VGIKAGDKAKKKKTPKSGSSSSSSASTLPPIAPVPLLVSEALPPILEVREMTLAEGIAQEADSEKSM
jgi:hypothetical protein